MENNDLVTRVVTSLDKHKADDIQVIQVTELTSLGDYFVIANGSSNTQVKSLADYVEYDLSQQGIQPLRVEGYSSASWILIDYGSVMVHVFRGHPPVLRSGAAVERRPPAGCARIYSR